MQKINIADSLEYEKIERLHYDTYQSAKSSDKNWRNDRTS